MAPSPPAGLSPPGLPLASLLWLSLSVSLLHDLRLTRSPFSLFLFALALFLTCFSDLFSFAPPAPPAPLLTLPTSVHLVVPPDAQTRALLARHHPFLTDLVRQQPDSPSGVLPSRSPIPSPSPLPATQSPPAQQPVPPPSQQPAPAAASPPSQASFSAAQPTLDECGGALTRMEVVLLLEFIAEVIFVIIRFLATNDEDEPTLDMSFRAYIFMRAIYAVPVIALNVSVLWIGGGPTGACLPAHAQLQIAFTHLILYALFCIAFVAFGMYRLGEYDSEDSSTYYTYSSYSRTWPGRKYGRFY